MFKWLYSLHTPPSPRRERAESSQGISFLQYVNSQISERKPFSLVHILVDSGEVEKVQKLVDGHSSGNSIGVIVPVGNEHNVYSALEKLARASVETHVRIGSTSYDPAERKLAYLPPERRGKAEPEYTHLSAGDLLARVQRSYVHKSYGKAAPATRRAVSPQLASQ